MYCNHKCKSNSKRPVTPESDSSEISEDIDGLALLADTTEVPCNALALPSPSVPSNTINEENDMIDLLGLTLPTTSVSPDFPQTLPSPFDQPMNPYAAYTYPESQTWIMYNSYVTPWAQAQAQNHLQLQLQQSSYYPPSPWTSPTPNYCQSPLSNMKPYMLLNNTNVFPFQMLMQIQTATPIQNHNPFTSTTINGSSVTGQKVYVPPYKLFDDLNVFGNVSGGLKATNNPSPNFSECLVKILDDYDSSPMRCADKAKSNGKFLTVLRKHFLFCCPVGRARTWDWDWAIGSSGSGGLGGTGVSSFLLLPETAAAVLRYRSSLSVAVVITKFLCATETCLTQQLLLPETAAAVNSGGLGGTGVSSFLLLPETAAAVLRYRSSLSVAIVITKFLCATETCLTQQLLLPELALLIELFLAAEPTCYSCVSPLPYYRSLPNTSCRYNCCYSLP
ncbi:hypothetical protein GIB67_020787 [Kingdonia uniflora]|uniref:Uncharacterized protein n=1 Tax=Kingdonia uniflora TaxID=39325 RepID=A0A7J7M7F0_9MAGN|nr:hypothetical protein GIB67_020787 [Kingdonia uniflora]